MKPLYVVEVDDSQKPLFPDMCLACGRRGAEKPIMLLMTDEHGRVDFYFYKLLKSTAQGLKLEFPVHDACAREVRNAFLKHFALIILAAVLIVAGGIVVQHLAIGIVIALLAATPFLYLEFTKPVPVEFLHYNGRYVLIFRDSEYAETVARLNVAKVEQDSNPYAGFM